MPIIEQHGSDPFHRGSKVFDQGTKRLVLQEGSPFPLKNYNPGDLGSLIQKHIIPKELTPTGMTEFRG